MMKMMTMKMKMTATRELFLRSFGKTFSLYGTLTMMMLLTLPGRELEEEKMIGVEEGREDGTEEGWFLAMGARKILIPAREEEER